MTFYFPPPQKKEPIVAQQFLIHQQLILLLNYMIRNNIPIWGVRYCFKEATSTSAKQTSERNEDLILEVEFEESD